MSERNDPAQELKRCRARLEDQQQTIIALRQSEHELAERVDELSKAATHSWELLDELESWHADEGHIGTVYTCRIEPCWRVERWRQARP
jgi:hypothetical protein